MPSSPAEPTSYAGSTGAESGSFTPPAHPPIPTSPMVDYGMFDGGGHAEPPSAPPPAAPQSPAWTPGPPASPAPPPTAAPATPAAFPGFDPVDAAPRAAAPLPSSEVRKIVTIIFSDLKGSTALTEKIDAEAINEVKERYFTSMAAEITRHGGKIEKYIGDAIMAVFGLPRAHEDDALRAVRAAHGMTVGAWTSSTRTCSRSTASRSPPGPASTPARSSRTATRTPSSAWRPATRSTSPPGSSRPPRPTRSSSAR